jgi:hypothetical protein
LAFAKRRKRLDFTTITQLTSFDLLTENTSGCLARRQDNADDSVAPTGYNAGVEFFLIPRGQP